MNRLTINFDPRERSLFTSEILLILFELLIGFYEDSMCYTCLIKVDVSITNKMCLRLHEGFSIFSQFYSFCISIISQCNRNIRKQKIPPPPQFKKKYIYSFEKFVFSLFYKLMQGKFNFQSVKLLLYFYYFYNYKLH